MITVEKLREFGANVEEGLGRCYGKEALYLRLVGIMVADTHFEALKEALDQNDLDKGFEAAHALKGALGNLSLSPLYDEVIEITELLREKTEMDYSDKVAKILADRDRLKEMCE